jgi:benzodiazapine receptor
MNAVSSDMAGPRALHLVCFVALAWLPGVVGAQFGPDAWYAALHKPLITPSNAVFAIIWPVLYTLSGIAAWLAWDSGRRLHAAHALWVALLALTALWPWLFFGLHRMDVALAAIVLLLPIMSVLLVAFWRIRPLALLPLLPYFAWLLFAALLNIAFVGLN